jgi:hypothetical protein
MEMEFMSELLATVKERMKSKLISSFVIAWLVYNYQLVLVIVGDGGFSEKLYFITNEMKFDGFSLLSPNFLCPVAIALVYIWIVPVIEGGVYFIQMYCVGCKKRLMMKADDIIPVDKDEHLAMRNKLNNVIEIRDEEIAALGEGYRKDTEGLTRDVAQHVSDLSRQCIFRFIAESGMDKAEYNTLSNIGSGSVLSDSSVAGFKGAPFYEAMKCFHELTKEIAPLGDADDRFIERHKLGNALGEHLDSHGKADFILLLKSLRLISESSKWPNAKYSLTREDRRNDVYHFLEHMIYENYDYQARAQGFY